MRIAALLYHELRRDGVPLCRAEQGYALYCVREAEFARHVEQLAVAGFRGIAVGDFVDGRAQPGDVILTFDDGCGSDLSVASPVLERAGFRATFFVTAGIVGQPGYLSADDVRELRQRGFEVGSHAFRHRYLTDLTRAEIQQELADSRSALAELTGTPIEHFSFPGGRFDAEVLRLVGDARYRSACTSRPGFNTTSTDRLRLRRLSVTTATRATTVCSWAAGRGAAGAIAREHVLRGVKRVLGNERYDRLRGALLRR